MFRFLAAPLLALTLLASPAAAADKAQVDQGLASQVMRSVALLYSQDQSGGMKMHCTVTAFEKISKGYLFVSAAHCIGDDDAAHEKVARYEDIPFYITYDERGEKVFYPATVVAVGYQHRGDDFAVFEVYTDKTWPTVPLGDETKISIGIPETTAILNVASPMGLGKQMFQGTVSNVYLDRPVVDGDINWKGTMLLSIQAGPGSSGSAIVSEQQRAIVGFLVGTAGGNNVIAMPVSRFKEFRKGVSDHKYRWFRPDTNDAPAN